MKRIVVLALIVAVAVGGCSSTGSSRTTVSRTTVSHIAVPSSADKLVCSNDAVSDISASLGVGVTEPLAPTWSGGVYSCRYVFSAGVMVLSVTDHPDAAAATAAFTSGQPADAMTIPAVGQQAYSLANGSAVVRKDAFVLTIDVSSLPATFGVPPHPRNIDAITVADTILACWTQDQ